MRPSFTPRIPAWLTSLLAVLCVSLTASCSSAPEGPAAAGIAFEAPIHLEISEAALATAPPETAPAAVRASLQPLPQQREMEAVPPVRAPLSQGLWTDPEQHSLGDVLRAVVPQRNLPGMLGGHLVPLFDPTEKELGLVLEWEF